MVDENCGYNYIFSGYRENDFKRLFILYVRQYPWVSPARHNEMTYLFMAGCVLYALYLTISAYLIPWQPS